MKKKNSSKWLETYMILAKNVRGRVRIEEHFFWEKGPTFFGKFLFKFA
jgi:hypothetical protein